jgi:hypothetical protein
MHMAGQRGPVQHFLVRRSGAKVTRRFAWSHAVSAELLQGGRTRVRPMLMNAAATILVLVPLALSSGGGLIAASLATGPARYSVAGAASSRACRSMVAAAVR